MRHTHLNYGPSKRRREVSVLLGEYQYDQKRNKKGMLVHETIAVRTLLLLAFGGICIPTLHAGTDMDNTSSSKELRRGNGLFQLINLEFPGLEEVKEYVEQGDRGGAKNALAEYFRFRNVPEWPVDRDRHKEETESKKDRRKRNIDKS